MISQETVRVCSFNLSWNFYCYSSLKEIHNDIINVLELCYSWRINRPFLWTNLRWSLRVCGVLRNQRARVPLHCQGRVESSVTLILEAVLSNKWKSFLFECSNRGMKGKPSLWWLLQRTLHQDKIDQWVITNRGWDQKAKGMVEKVRSFIGKAGSWGFKFRMNQKSLEQETWNQGRTCMNGVRNWGKDWKIRRSNDLNSWTSWRGRRTQNRMRMRLTSSRRWKSNRIAWSWSLKAILSQRDGRAFKSWMIKIQQNEKFCWGLRKGFWMKVKFIRIKILD